MSGSKLSFAFAGDLEESWRVERQRPMSAATRNGMGFFVPQWTCGSFGAKRVEGCWLRVEGLKSESINDKGVKMRNLIG